MVVGVEQSELGHLGLSWGVAGCAGAAEAPGYHSSAGGCGCPYSGVALTSRFPGHHGHEVSVVDLIILLLPRGTNLCGVPLCDMMCTAIP